MLLIAMRTGLITAPTPVVPFQKDISLKSLAVGIIHKGFRLKLMTVREIAVKLILLTPTCFNVAQMDGLKWSAKT